MSEVQIIQVPVVKAKGKFVELKVNEVNADVWSYLIALGAKALVNRGTSGEGKKDLSDDEYVEIAMKQVEDMYSGKTRIIGQKRTAGKKDSVEMAEAVRIAKETVKQQIKAAGQKISHYTASEITKYAKAYVEADPDTYLGAARENLARAAVAVGKPPKASLGFTPDPKKVAAAEKKTAERKAAKGAQATGKTPPPKPKAKPAGLHA